jgi:hypothetical protein
MNGNKVKPRTKVNPPLCSERGYLRFLQLA